MRALHIQFAEQAGSSPVARRLRQKRTVGIVVEKRAGLEQSVGVRDRLPARKTRIGMAVADWAGSEQTARNIARSNNFVQ